MKPNEIMKTLLFILLPLSLSAQKVYTVEDFEHKDTVWLHDGYVWTDPMSGTNGRVWTKVGLPCDTTELHELRLELKKERTKIEAYGLAVGVLAHRLDQIQGKECAHLFEWLYISDYTNDGIDVYCRMCKTKLR